MAALTGIYVGKDATELAALKTQLETARTSILTGHQSGSRPGFSYSKAALSDILNELHEVEYAIRLASGSLANRTYADLSA